MKHISIHPSLRVALLCAVSVPLAFAPVGCDTWQSADHSKSWESGTASAAGWKTNAGSASLGKITVLESEPTSIPAVDANITQTAYNAIGCLLATARPPIVGADQFNSSLPVLSFTTVDLNDFTKTNNFGRLMGEALTTALTQHWRNKVIKMTLRQGDAVLNATPPVAGEFLLSRQARQLALDFNAGAVLVSTYSVSPDKVYVTVELINVHHNGVVAATQFAIPNGLRTRALLGNLETPEEIESMLKRRTQNGLTRR